jgi:hypothetical protein
MFMPSLPLLVNHSQRFGTTAILRGAAGKDSGRRLTSLGIRTQLGLCDRDRCG